MNRYQPPPRDRSPPRHPERRTSAPYATTPGTASHRASNDPHQISLDRPPPRGPKAESFRGNFQYGAASRGRGGFPGRSETWDRDRERDSRDNRPVPSSSRRDDDRPDWRSRDRDLYPSERGAIAGRDARPYNGRDRSASPTRARRRSKEDLYSAAARNTEASTWAPSRGGAPRGRGWDYDRGRGRPLLNTDRGRELFPPRSRSGETRRERERDREGDWLDTNERRDMDRSRERETRPREHDSWSSRDRPPSRQDSDTAGKPIATPTITTSAAVSDSSYGPGEKLSQQELVQRPSMGPISANGPRESYKAGEPAPFTDARTEPGSRDFTSSRMFCPAPTLQPVTASLDYGPPPVPAVTDKSRSSVPLLRSADPSTEGHASFQPPTGPKAERSIIGAPLTIAAAKTTTAENRAKTDPRPRSLLAAPAQDTLAIAPQAAKVVEITKDPRLNTATTGDRALLSNVPAGPRSSTVNTLKPLRLAKDQFPTSSPPTAPKSIVRGLEGDQIKAIPTGPRAYKQENRPPPPKGPSIFGTMPRDRSATANNQARSETAFRQPPSGPRGPPSIFNRPSAAQNHDDARRLQPGSTATFNEDQRHLEEQEHEDMDMSGTASSEEEIEDEDALDEADFLVLEEKHRKEVKVLESRKPVPLLKDPTIVALLLRIQMLGMIADNAIPAVFRSQIVPVEDEVMEDVGSTGLLSPQHGSDDEVKSVPTIIPVGRPLKDLPVNPIPTPPIEDLPYRSKSRPEFVSFEDSDDEVEREAAAVLIQQEFEKKAFQWRDEVDVLRNNYRENYLAWRVSTMDLDLKKELRSSTPAPASPAPSSAAPVTPLLQERTRGAKNATELDFEAVLRMSEQSAREEEERREREKSKPNPDSEADIPAMLPPSDVEVRRFKDTNHLIPHALAIDIFGLIPPVDDFSEEEQKLFTAAYIRHPKKFGRIAERLPDRTYQQCIMHYYLTKDEAQYKECFRRAAPKRGRRKLPTQNRANALLTDSIYQDEAEILPVTDSGRPRRAAAPTFGDVVADPDTPLPNQAMRRTLNVKESNGEPTTKPTRGRKAGMGTKIRRTKAQIQEDARLAHQQTTNGLEPSPRKGRPTGADRADKGPALASGVLSTPLQQVESVRTLDGEVGLQQQASADFIPTQTMLEPELSSTPQIGSYWSVPEQQKFPELVAYFGRDWPAIANFMKTKSVVMIKNFYQRQLDGGKRDLEQSAMLAEDRRARGEPVGPPPTPIAPQKRRYESTPSLAAAPRNIASAVDGILGGGDVSAPRTGHTLIDEFDPNTVQRGIRGELMAKPRDPANPSSLPPPQHVDELTTEVKRPGLQQSHLARNSYSRDERHEGPGSQISLLNEDTLLHHHPQTRTVALTREEQQQSRPQLAQPQTATRDIPPQQQPSGLQYLHSDANRASQLHGVHGHARTNSSLSSIAPTPSLLERTAGSPFGRQEQSQRPFYFDAGPAQSPTLAPQGVTTQQRADLIRPHSTPAEPPKPAAAKRSNITDLLNAPSEPKPDERQPVETTRISSVASPPPSLVRRHQILERGRDEPQPEQMGGYTHSRSGLEQQRHSIHHTPQSSAGVEYGSPALAQMQPWLHRFDPRPPSSTPDRQPAAPTPQGHSHYPVAPPPSTQASSSVPLQRLQQMDTSNRTDANRVTGADMSHRRSILGQLDFPRLAPSPPPQQQSPLFPNNQYTLGPPRRSTSGTSHRGRVESVSYGTGPQLQQQQQQQQQHSQSQTHAHVQSLSSTPLSTLHSNHQVRNQSSVGYETRFGLGQRPPGIQLLQQQMVDRERESREDAERRHDREVQQSVLKAQQDAVRARERDREFAEQRAKDRAHAQVERDIAMNRSRGLTGLLGTALGPTPLRSAEQTERERRHEIDLQSERDRRDVDMRRHKEPVQHGPEVRAQEREAPHELPKRYEYHGVGHAIGPGMSMLSRRADSFGGREGRDQDQEIQRQRDAIRERDMALERDLGGSRPRVAESAPRTFTPPSGHAGTGFSLGLGSGGPFLNRAPAPLVERDASSGQRSGPRPLPPMRGTGGSTDGPGQSHFRSMSQPGGGAEEPR